MIRAARRALLVAAPTTWPWLIIWSVIGVGGVFVGVTGLASGRATGGVWWACLVNAVGGAVIIVSVLLGIHRRVKEQPQLTAEKEFIKAVRACDQIPDTWYVAEGQDAAGNDALFGYVRGGFRLPFRFGPTLIRIDTLYVMLSDDADAALRVAETGEPAIVVFEEYEVRAGKVLRSANAERARLDEHGDLVPVDGPPGISWRQRIRNRATAINAGLFDVDEVTLRRLTGQLVGARRIDTTDPDDEEEEDE